VSSPVELEQCDEETLAAILGTHAKVSISVYLAPLALPLHNTLFHDMPSSAAKTVICKHVCMTQHHCTASVEKGKR